MVLPSTVTPPSPRRRLLLGTTGLVSLLAVSGCGWRIRGAMDFGFQRIMVVAPGQGPQIDRGRAVEANGGPAGAPAAEPELAQTVSGGGLSERLRRELSARYRRTLVTRANDAEVVLRINTFQLNRLVVGFSGTGRPRELEVRMEVGFSIEDPIGRPLIPSDTLTSRQIIAINETDVLSSSDAERFQINAMEEDLIQQILRRLSGLSRRATPVRPPPA
jgi:LPS-assembly lipoprotein